MSEVDVQHLIETSPGVYEVARHRYLLRRIAKPGDTVLHSEQLDDGSWTEWRPIRVVEDAK